MLQEFKSVEKIKIAQVQPKRETFPFLPALPTNIASTDGSAIHH
jgi:hypothetical protein